MRTQVLSYGGGWQTVAMCVLILQGRLPRPDLIVMADTGREKSSTFDYLDEIVQPALEREGMRAEIAPHSLATVDLYAHNGDLLIPAYTKTGKLPTFCSNEWKQRVVMRYLKSAGVGECDAWIGFSADEADRVDALRSSTSLPKWYSRTTPLYDMGITRADCGVIVENYGWPPPVSSACWMCPNMDDAEWYVMRRDYPGDFQKAVELQNEIQEWDNEIWLTDHRKPLEQVEFDPNGHSKKKGRHQCSMFCMI